MMRATQLGQGFDRPMPDKKEKKKKKRTALLAGLTPPQVRETDPGELGLFHDR